MGFQEDSGSTVSAVITSSTMPGFGPVPVLWSSIGFSSVPSDAAFQVDNTKDGELVPNNRAETQTGQGRVL